MQDDSEDDSIADEKVEIASDDEELANKRKGKRHLDEDVKEEDFD